MDSGGRRWWWVDLDTEESTTVCGCPRTSVDGNHSLHVRLPRAWTCADVSGRATFDCRSLDQPTVTGPSHVGGRCCDHWQSFATAYLIGCLKTVVQQQSLCHCENGDKRASLGAAALPPDEVTAQTLGDDHVTHSMIDRLARMLGRAPWPPTRSSGDTRTARR